MSAVLTAMRPSDADRCAELETLLFAGDGPWSAAAFRSELAHAHNHYVVVRGADDRVIGYAGIALLGTAPDIEAEVHTIGVDPEHRRRGLGSVLLAALLGLADRRAAAVFLEVRTDNDAAITLYRREGFEVVGTRRNYYQPSGADAYTMRRPASSPEPEEQQS